MKMWGDVPAQIPDHVDWRSPLVFPGWDKGDVARPADSAAKPPGQGQSPCRNGRYVKL